MLPGRSRSCFSMVEEKQQQQFTSFKSYLSFSSKLSWVGLRLTNNLNFTTCLSNKLILFNSSRETPFICWSSLKSSCLFCTFLGRVGGWVCDENTNKTFYPANKDLQGYSNALCGNKKQNYTNIAFGFKVSFWPFSTRCTNFPKGSFPIKKARKPWTGSKVKMTPPPPKIKLKLF